MLPIALIGSVGIALAPALAEAASATSTAGAATPNPGLKVTLTTSPRSAFGYDAYVTVGGLLTGSAEVTVEWGDGSDSTFVDDAGAPTSHLTHSYSRLGTYTITATANDGAGDTASSSASDLQTEGSEFTAYGPVRILDTRNGTGAKAAALPAGGELHLQVTGAGLKDAVIPAGITAVVLNVTATEETANGVLTVCADQGPLGDPLGETDTSNLNFRTGQNIANLVVVPVGKNGVVDFYNGGSKGSAEVIADVAGYFTQSNALSYFPISPARILDARKGVGTGKVAQIPANGSITLTVAGADDGAISDDASAVALSLTAVNATHNGDITAYPANPAATVPNVSNLNYSPDAATANTAIVPLSDIVGDGSKAGQIVLHNSGDGPVDLIADAVGYYAGGLPGGSAYVPLSSPNRFIDTRQPGDPVRGPVATQTPIPLAFGGPEEPFTAGVFNATVVSPTGNGFLSLYPYNPDDPTAVPSTSNLNYRTGQTVPALVTVPSGTQANADDQYEIGIYLGGEGTAQVILDWFGYYQNQ